MILNILNASEPDVLDMPPIVEGPSHVLIAERAYELFCQRGSIDGDDVNDWLEAERELLEAAARSGTHPLSD